MMKADAGLRQFAVCATLFFAAAPSASAGSLVAYSLTKDIAIDGRVEEGKLTVHVTGEYTMLNSMPHKLILKTSLQGDDLVLQLIFQPLWLTAIFGIKPRSYGDYDMSSTTPGAFSATRTFRVNDRKAVNVYYQDHEDRHLIKRIEFPG